MARPTIRGCRVGCRAHVEAIVRPEGGCLCFRSALWTLEGGEVLALTDEVDNAAMGLPVAIKTVRWVPQCRQSPPLPRAQLAPTPSCPYRRTAASGDAPSGLKPGPSFLRRSCRPCRSPAFCPG